MLSRIPLKIIADKILENPSYIPVAAKALWRKHIDANIDIARKDGIAKKPPIQISLRITNRCNQRCAICGQFGLKGYINKGGVKDFSNELDLDMYKKLVDEVCENRPIFYITGGEALLYKDLFNLTGYIKKKKCYVYVITNGSLLHEFADEIIKQEWDMLTVSLDGPKEIHDKCRGMEGTFDKTIRGIELLLKDRIKKPFFVLCATVSLVNQNYLFELFDVVDKIKPDALVLYLSWFTTENIGKKHSRILKDEMGIDAFSWQSYVGQNIGIDTEKLTDTLKTLLKNKYSFPWFYIPYINLDKIHIYYNEPENFLGYGPCAAPYIMVDIMPNGDVVTCRDFVDIKVGNIKEKPLLEIWNNDIFKNFRLLLQKNNGTLPQCSRCCGLMGF